jgi:aqualysin 1
MRRFPMFSVLLGLLFFAACDDQPPGPLPAEPALNKSSMQERNEEDLDIRDRYIVVFKRSVRNTDALIDELTRGSGGQIHYRYHTSIKGFCATLPPHALEAIRRNPNVDYIEADGIMSINTIQNVTSQLWGLDRIDQRSLPLSSTYEYLADGTGVRAYIIDTGIRYTHVEFGNRASFGFDAFGGNGSDGNGHGTHVAGTVGGINVGVAKNVNLVSIRVLNNRGSGTTSGIIAGVEWVTQNHVKPAVANMSLGGGISITLEQAVQYSVLTGGVTYVVAAGNNSADACNYSPARLPEAITVASTTNTDVRSSFSNYGSCVNVFAPGSSIYSAYKNNNTSYQTLSGTSMAAPHVAGVAALYLQGNPSATPSTVENAIYSAATSGVLGNIGANSPNRLLYSLLAASPSPTPPNAPSNLTASVQSATSVQVQWTDNSNDETGFEIDYTTDHDFLSNVQTETVGQNGTSASIGNLSTNTTYYFRVRAYRTDNNGTLYSAWSNPASATPQTSITVRVASATSGSTSTRNNWTATLAVVVTDMSNNAVPNATVTLSWSGGASGTSTGVTNANGQVTLSTSTLNKNVSYVDLSVTTITGTNLTYDANANQVSFPLRVNKP